MPNEGMQVAKDDQKPTNPRLAAIYKLIRRGQFDLAFQKILKLDPRSLNDIVDLNTYHFYKGRCLYGLEMYQDAIDAFMFVQAWEQMPTVLNALAYCYQKLGKSDVADNLFDNESTCLLLEMGNTSLNNGDYAKATKVFRVIPHWRDCKAAVEGLESAYLGMGLYDRARGLRGLIELKWPETRDLQAEAQKKLNLCLYPRFFQECRAQQQNNSQHLQALDLPQRKL